MLGKITRGLYAGFSRPQGLPVSNRIFNDYYKQNQEEIKMHFAELEKIGFSRSGIGKILKEKP